MVPFTIITEPKETFESSTSHALKDDNQDGNASNRLLHFSPAGNSTASSSLMHSSKRPVKSGFLPVLYYYPDILQLSLIGDPCQLPPHGASLDDQMPSILDLFTQVGGEPVELRINTA